MHSVPRLAASTFSSIRALTDLPLRAASNLSAQAMTGEIRGLVVDEGDRLDLDHKIETRQAADFDRRAGRCGGAEIAYPHVAVFRELLVVGDVGVGLDDVGEGSARRLETGLDVFPDLL